MSYDAYDFFYEQIAPKMVELFKDFNPEESEGKVYDKFKEILSHNDNEKFKTDILNLLVDPNNEGPIHQTMQEVFNILSFDEKILRKLEYSSGGAIIKVDYEGVYREQEKEEKE